MPDSTPSTGDRTVVVHRHSALTYISLGFNALILLLILIGIVCGHHHKRHHHGEWGGGGFRHQEWADRGDRGFDHHGFGPMHGDRDDRGPGDRDGGDRGGWDHHDIGAENHPGLDDHNPGFGPGGPGGPKPDFGGFGPGGMDHFKPMTPPNAEEMTDRLMLMLDQKLTLTDAESAQIRPLVQGDIAQFQKDMEAQKDAHQKMIEDAKAKVRAVLTPDQQKQFDQLAAGFGAPPPPPPPPAPK
jgi:hypothetical protein